MKLIGLDISSGYATAFLLDELPTNYKEFIASPAFTPFEVKPIAEDLQALVNLQADCIILEPTGYHLERVFCNYFDRHNQPYRRATGRRIASFRAERGLSKTDDIDALSLAAFGLTYWHDAKAFIPKCELEELRQTWLQRYGLMKAQNRFINRLRLQLAHEFPEMASKDWERRWNDQPYGLIRWMAGEEMDKRVLTRYLNQHAATIGTGISEYSRSIARHLNSIQRQMQSIESEINQILSEERFQPYVAAMEEIGFSRPLMSIWLTRIYPFERFLGADGKVIEMKRTSKQGKPVTHNQSLAQFKAAIGAGMVENSSGTRQPRSKQKNARGWRGRNVGRQKNRDTRAEVPMGCRFCRQSFFLWSLNQVEPGYVAKTPLGEQLYQKRNQLKEDGRNLYQRSGTLQGYAARMLFRELKGRLLDR